MTSSNTITLTTGDLSEIANQILNALSSDIGKSPISKSTILNIMAGTIAGPKHNWGFLKNSPQPLLSTSARNKAPKPLPRSELQIARDDLKKAATQFIEKSSSTRLSGAFARLYSKGRDEVLISLSGNSDPTSKVVKDATLSGADILLLNEAFSQKGPFEYLSENGLKIIFKENQDSVVISDTRADFELQNTINVSLFRSTITKKLPEVVKANLHNDPFGHVQAAHSAFVNVGETDTTIQAALCEGSLEIGALDFACEVAAATIAANLSEGERQLILIHGTQWIVDEIYDKRWYQLFDFLDLEV